MLQAATCAKLYTYPDRAGAAGTTVVPEVAASLPHLSPDGKTHTIEMRRTYRFHTGQRITATNYVAAFNRAANPQLQSPAQTYLREIVGANAAMAGSAESISGVQALGRYRLRIRTTRRVPDLVARLTMPYFCPIAVNTPIDPAGISAPLGSGPYFVASRVPNRLIVLERNRHYRGPRAANVDRVVWEIGRTPEACRVALDDDAVDYCLQIPVTAWEEIAGDHPVNAEDGRLFRAATLGVWFFAFNHDRPAFRGPGQIPLKKAINLALDRPAFVRLAGPLGAVSTDQLLPPALGRPASIYPSGRVSEARLRRARAVLADARRKPKRLVLYAPNVGLFVPRSEIFRSSMQRLGIDVVIQYFSPDSWLERIGTRGEPFDVTLSGWGADYADADAILRPLVDGTTLRDSNNTNYAYYDNAAVNRELAGTRLLTGRARRRALADLDVRLMRDDPPYAPFLNTAARVFVSASTGCVVIDRVSAGLLNLVAACKK
jgi:peptide/nickel transport system substrate-binding protein